jgi:ATP phosphoribosyltransferase regulatory subunit
MRGSRRTASTWQSCAATTTTAAWYLRRTGAAAIALGGRYDEVGKAFGRARPATGFTMDLRELAALGDGVPALQRILAPWQPQDAELRAAVEGLRAGGEVVVWDLPGHDGTRGELDCDRELVLQGGQWVVVNRRS